MNRCEHDGLLVGPAFALATSDTDYQWIGRSPEVGCTNIRCTHCGKRVRVFVRTYLIPPERDRPDYHAIYDSGGEHAQLKPWEKTNLYLCYCGAERVDGIEYLDQQNDMGWRRYPKWRCGGHPQ